MRRTQRDAAKRAREQIRVAIRENGHAITHMPAEIVLQLPEVLAEVVTIRVGIERAVHVQDDPIDHSLATRQTTFRLPPLVDPQSGCGQIVDHFQGGRRHPTLDPRPESEIARIVDPGKRTQVAAKVFLRIVIQRIVQRKLGDVFAGIRPEHIGVQRDLVRDSVEVQQQTLHGRIGPPERQADANAGLAKGP